jgi:Spx/MgsR family transcriptional regulator
MPWGYKMITLYGLKKCSTCVKACTWFETQKIAFQFIDYRDDPIEPDYLIAWSKQLGGWEKLVNRASMTWRNLSDTEKQQTQALDQGQNTNAIWLNLIARFPALIRRPLTVWEEGAVSVGFNEKKFLIELNKL